MTCLENVKRGNLFSPVTKSDEEFVDVLISGKSGGSRVERIISHGHVSPPGFWYINHQEMGYSRDNDTREKRILRYEHNTQAQIKTAEYNSIRKDDSAMKILRRAFCLYTLRKKSEVFIKALAVILMPGMYFLMRRIMTR